MLIPQSKYYNHSEMTSILFKISTDYQQFVDIESIGKSIEGRDIWAVTMTNKDTGSHDTKPALFVDACVHAGEVTGTQTCLYLIGHILENLDDHEIKNILDTKTIYVIPRINPDGAEKFLNTSFESWGNMRPFPERKDWEGLERFDVDGNNLLLLMRKKDSNGEWKISQKDSRLMIPRKPYEITGEFYSIYPEGKLVGECVNVDDFKVLPKEFQMNMNRNYADGWNIKTGKLEGGNYPFSEPEVFAVASFMMQHKNIGLGNDFHTNGGVLIRPYSYQGDCAIPGEDLALFDVIGKVGKEFTGYDLISAFEGFSPGIGDPRRGCIDDWAYECLGVLMITTELWNMSELAGVERNPGNYYPNQEKTEDDEIRMLEWNDKMLGGEGFIPWKQFLHEDLGEIEIGGWNWKFTSKNPPIKFLEEECKKSAIHSIKQASMLPQIILKSHSVEKLEQDLYSLKVVFENTGYLPSNISKKAIENKAVDEVMVEIENANVEYINCNRTINIGHLNGRHRFESNFYFGEPSEGISRKTASCNWIIKAEENTELKVSLISDKAGKLNFSIILV